jgi:fumarylacetoacetate (FAA) hydrolase family protein/TRAP-type C4-dicarboxylate transport system permease small subunit
LLPEDGLAGTLVGRVWLPGPLAGPAVVALRADGVYDLSRQHPTMSSLLDAPDPAREAREALGPRLCGVAELLANSGLDGRDENRPWLLAPCDLQVVKAAGVTFAASLVERVIEEQARGDASRAQGLRAQVQALIGDSLARIRPGSPQAMALKTLLQQQGLWSQYLEVGIGPDAEVFTKAPVLASVGPGADIGIRADSAWNNPEPELVLAVNSRGDIVGASLGNDVNLRDIEGRSALLLGKAKDNNASCAIGPFIRLFDAGFGLAQLRAETVHLHVRGDGFELRGINTMASISRDPTELVAQTLAAHQYPDGFMLFLGTCSRPSKTATSPAAASPTTWATWSPSTAPGWARCATACATARTRRPGATACAPSWPTWPRAACWPARAEAAGSLLPGPARARASTKNNRAATASPGDRNMLDTLIDRYCRFINLLIALALALMVVLVFGNVVLRYAFNSGIAVSEGCRAGSSCGSPFWALSAIKENAHLGTDMLVSRLPVAGKFCLVLSQLLMLYITWLFFDGSLQQTRINWDVRPRSPAPRPPSSTPRAWCSRSAPRA